MKMQCSYCRRFNDESQELCASCGAPLEYRKVILVPSRTHYGKFEEIFYNNNSSNTFPLQFPFTFPPSQVDG